MFRTLALLIGFSALTAPARADNNGIRQSPLLMRRAGPSCQPGDLGGQPGAGYLYRLGPCAGVDGGDAPRGPRRPGAPPPPLTPQRRGRPGDAR